MTSKHHWWVSGALAPPKEVAAVVFIPPRCPYPLCTQHKAPEAQFFLFHGHYPTKCRGRVPRFRCRSCLRTFSRQTLRHDYYDKKPDLNAEVFDRLIASGGLRETAFRVHMTRNNLEAKARKIARTLGLLHENMLENFPLDSRFQLDEMVSFEANRRTRPLTVPVLIESGSYFIVGAECAPIRPSGRMTPERRLAIDRDEKRFGKRVDLSRPCLRGLLHGLARHLQSHPTVHLRTDKKEAYRRLAREAFGAKRLVHESFSSKIRRNPRNPLFRINLTNAMSRDYNGRLRRRTWLCSKEGKYLRLQLRLMIVFRNYIRPRTRQERATPSMCLGFTGQRLDFHNCLSWRQDWAELSVRPDQNATRSYAEQRAA